MPSPIQRALLLACGLLLGLQVQAQSVALTNPDGGDLFAPLVAASEALRESIRGK